MKFNYIDIINKKRATKVAPFSLEQNGYGLYTINVVGSFSLVVTMKSMYPDGKLHLHIGNDVSPDRSISSIGVPEPTSKICTLSKPVECEKMISSKISSFTTLGPAAASLKKKKLTNSIPRAYCLKVLVDEGIEGCAFCFPPPANIESRFECNMLLSILQKKNRQKRHSNFALVRF